MIFCSDVLVLLGVIDIYPAYDLATFFSPTLSLKTFIIVPINICHCKC